MIFPEPLSKEGARRLAKLKLILSETADSDLVDALTELIQQMIDDGSFQQNLEKPFIVQDLLEEAHEHLARRQ